MLLWLKVLVCNMVDYLIFRLFGELICLFYFLFLGFIILILLFALFLVILKVIATVMLCYVMPRFLFSLFTSFYPFSSPAKISPMEMGE